MSASSTTTSTTHVYPRRRAAVAVTPAALPHLDTTTCHTILKDGLPLRKGATFASPTSAPSHLVDPILNIPSLPRRSPTSPRALKELYDGSEDLIAAMTRSFDKGFYGLITASNENRDRPLVSSSIKLHAAPASNSMPANANKEAHSTTVKFAKPALTGRVVLSGDVPTGEPRPSQGSTERDGSATNTRVQTAEEPTSTSSVYSPVEAGTPATEKLNAAKGLRGHVLSEQATKQIKKYIIEPILAQESLKDYHPLVEQLPERIAEHTITCLRDLEKTLIFLAPSSSKSAAAYLSFCETSIQCIVTTVGHLNDLDQRRPTDRPYTNTYFLDLVQQVQQYARIMAISRQKQAEGQPLDDKDYTPDETIKLHGGNGKPAELVREKDGKMISLKDGRVVESDEPLADDDELLEDDIERSMARKRKCDIGKEEYHACRECGKVFKRPCDLTKHEKTHSRPHKCSERGCKYYELGWPTEKERDRHVNDKHSNAPALYKCLYPPCSYTSKRESNCKQHMEKTHGWEYVRSKSKKGQSLVPTKDLPADGPMLTPSSGVVFRPLSMPGTPQVDSPMDSMTAASPAVSILTSTSAYMSTAPYSHSMSPVNFNDFTPANGQPFSFNDFSNTGLQSYTSAMSPGLSSDHRNSIGTPASYFTNYSELPDAYNAPFDYGQMDCPEPQDFFTQYNVAPNAPFTAQEPTPAWSDNMDFDVKPNHTAMQNPMIAPQLTPGAHGDIMIQGDRFPTPEADSFDGNFKRDFSLFGETGPSGGESSAMGHSQALFAEYDHVNDQFNTDPFEAMSDGSLGLEEYGTEYTAYQ